MSVLGLTTDGDLYEAIRRLEIDFQLKVEVQVDVLRRQHEAALQDLETRLRREQTAAEIPPQFAPRLEEVERQVAEAIADRVYNDVDTERVEEALAALIGERVRAYLDNSALYAAIAQFFLEDYAETDALQEQVAEFIAGRLEVRLRGNDEAVTDATTNDS